MTIKDSLVVRADYLRRIKTIGIRIGYIHAEADIGIQILDVLVGADDRGIEIGIAGLRVRAMVVDSVLDLVLAGEFCANLAHLAARCRRLLAVDDLLLAGNANENINSKSCGVVEILLGLIGGRHIYRPYAVRRNSMVGAFPLEFRDLRRR